MQSLKLEGTLVQCPGLKNLTGLSSLIDLDLASTPLTDEGLEYIGRMVNLRRLSLSYTDITDRGLAYLLQLPHLENLEDRKSTRLNSSHRCISYAVFCLKKKTNTKITI